MTNALDQLLERVRAAAVAMDLKDGQVPVRNVWLGGWSTLDRRQLPMIQLELLEAGEGRYATDSDWLTPFRVRATCWVEKGARPWEAEVRARGLREDLMRGLHAARPFSAVGAARQALRWRLEREPYLTPHALGAAVTVEGELFTTLKPEED